MTATFSELLAQRQFMRFWLARIFGVSGHQMLMLAISWQLYELTGSAWDLGLVGLIQFVPALIMACLRGRWWTACTVAVFLPLACWCWPRSPSYWG